MIQNWIKFIKLQMHYSAYEKYGLTQQQFAQIKQYFSVFDPKATGYVDPNEIKKILEDMGEQATSQTVYQQICTLCSQGQGQISFQQFVPLMTSKILKSDPLSQAQQLMELLDDQKRGYITVQTVRRAFNQLKIQVSQQTIEAMIKLSDKDKDLMIGVEQLKDLLSLIQEKRK